jgi:hypothetical protein
LMLWLSPGMATDIVSASPSILYGKTEMFR